MLVKVRPCVRCGTVLPLTDFTPHRLGRDGRQGACRACECERLAIRKHGLTSLEKEWIAEAQDGCAICGTTEPNGKGFVVDHDRSCCSGDVSCPTCRRGILCHRCNTAMGYALDSPTMLRRMADYLELGTRLADPTQLTEDRYRLLRDGTNALTENRPQIQPSLTLSDAHAQHERPAMKRYLIPVVVLAFCAPTPAQAVTHAPCTYRYAGPPSVQLVQGGQSTLAGSGTVGGCPSPVGSESVTVTVSLERYDGTAWQPVSSATATRGWSRITRGARQVSATTTTTCVSGPWRTRLTSYDSAPIDVTSSPVTFTAGDSGVCGSYGGGDG